MEESILDNAKSNENTQTSTFKKPILIGKVGRLPRKTIPLNNIAVQNNATEEIQEVSLDKTIIQDVEDVPASTSNDTPVSVPEQETKEQSIAVAYKEPTWSGLPPAELDYSFEVLKSGVIIERISLIQKSFWMFGRLPTCDVYMAHPTISRHHAVLQYKAVGSDDRPAGFYIFDLGSTHGTFLNKSKLKPKMYVRIQVGHMLKLGCSTRTFLLVGPDDDAESETGLSVTEQKEKRAEELRQREERELKAAQAREEQKKKEEERGVDWGMGEDADEETDLAENPYAETNNEQLYLEDPKRALRGFMEREGLELQYEVTERGVGQFLCSVALPLDDARGRPLVAEALVKGKKKEAVVQCALEACRILDRHGVLRQATHESRKRKAKDWQENDFYDSDEDTFLDRTGTIERKRERRMRAKQPKQPDTYQSLVAREQAIAAQLRAIEQQLAEAARSQPGSSQPSAPDHLDPLDRFMTELGSTRPDKYTLGRLKTELAGLRKEHAEVVRLVNIARPAHLPPLIVQSDNAAQNVASTSGSKPAANKALPMFGKRLKVKVMLPARDVPAQTLATTSSSESSAPPVEDTEPVEEQQVAEATETSAPSPQREPEPVENESAEGETQSPATRKGIIKQLEIKVSMCDEKALASLDNKVKAKISKTVTKLRKIAEEEERIVVDEKRLAVQKKKIIEQVNTTDAKDIEKHIKLSKAMNKMTGEYCMIGDRKLKIVEKINKLADDINNIAVEIRSASKLQHEQAVNRMKEFVEKAHRQQTEIFRELEKLENPVADQQVIEKLKELYEWLCDQKIKMLENLEKLKNVKLTEDSQLLEDIIEFELKSDKFITTILEEIRKIRSSNEAREKEKCPPKRLRAEDEDSNDEDESESPADAERRRKKNLRRIAQRQERAELERKKQYEEDARRDNYSMWVPPEGQTGDGRTTLNERFGY